MANPYLKISLMVMSINNSEENGLRDLAYEQGIALASYMNGLVDAGFFNSLDKDFIQTAINGVPAWIASKVNALQENWLK